MLRVFAHALVLLAALLVLTPATAQLRVEITGVGSSQFPIAVANFRRDGEIPQPIDEIIRAVGAALNGCGGGTKRAHATGRAAPPMRVPQRQGLPS